MIRCYIFTTGFCHFQTFYERPDGSALLHIVPQCPRNFHLGYVIKKGWPHKTKFVRVLEQFYEGGILQVWYAHVEHSMILSRRRDQKFHRNIAIKFEDLRILFLVWLIGLLLAALVFLVELHLLYCKPKKGILP